MFGDVTGVLRVVFEETEWSAEPSYVVPVTVLRVCSAHSSSRLYRNNKGGPVRAAPIA